MARFDLKECRERLERRLKKIEEKNFYDDIEGFIAACKKVWDGERLGLVVDDEKRVATGNTVVSIYPAADVDRMKYSEIGGVPEYKKDVDEAIAWALARPAQVEHKHIMCFYSSAWGFPEATHEIFVE